ncbi:MAG: hypothetical protein JW987_15965 [Anaerolineaceae bacterium]|nr:hypothetical protein [Anaerolineaceae bacterium]
MTQSLQHPQIYLVSGGRGAGKTTFCQTVAAAAKQKGWNVTGILSLPRYEEDRRVAIDAVDLRSGESRLLANRRAERLPEQLNWDFQQSILAWADAQLGSACPCDLLVVDELGPLEFERNQGWLSALSTLDRGEFRIALVVVRPHLLFHALERWGDSRVIEIETRDESAEKAAAFCSVMI